MMKAIQVAKFGGPEVLKIVNNVPMPIISAKQVLIRVNSAGVNPVETYIRTGTHKLKPTLPYIPGGDAAGIVDKVGEEVTKFKAGDRVYTVRTVTGSYAEYCVADDSSTFPLPSNVTYDEGAAIGTPYFSAYRSYKKAHTKPGETVLVHGASGAVGVGCCQIFNAYGNTVFGTAGTKEGLKQVEECGATKVFNHRDENYQQEIMDSTDGRGVDVIIEMLANVNLQRDLEMVAQGGRIIVIGSRGSVEVTPRLLMMKEAIVSGLMLYAMCGSDLEEYGAAISRGFSQGWIKPIIGTQYKLEDVERAHVEVIAQSNGTHGKIVLNIS